MIARRTWCHSHQADKIAIHSKHIQSKHEAQKQDFSLIAHFIVHKRDVTRDKLKYRTGTHLSIQHKHNLVEALEP